MGRDGLSRVDGFDPDAESSDVDGEEERVCSQIIAGRHTPELLQF